MKRYYLAALVLVIIALAAGIANTLVSKPYITDRIITEDLRTLDSSIVSYYDEHQKLPDTLDQLTIDEFNTSANLKSRMKAYDYTPGSTVMPSPTPSPKPGLYFSADPLVEESFTLCATFKTATKDGQVKTVASEYFDPGTHGKGRQCFTGYVSGN